MKCIYCNKNQQPLKIGGMVTITCCDKIQILRYTVRANVMGFCENTPDVVLVDIDKRGVMISQYCPTSVHKLGEK